MQSTFLGSSSLRVSRLAYGCWRIAGTWDPREITAEGEAKGRKAVLSAFENGFTFFDHADIYCHGESERIFGQVLKQTPGMRDKVVIATKCGIRPGNTPEPGLPGRYDFSAEHILRSCEGSLKRLGIETIDLYQLHRPDYLMDPGEVASAFDQLKTEGKVREFGVSNFRPSQVTLLQRACRMKLQVNQVEINLAHLQPLEDGTLDQCLTESITPMAWSPLGGGHLGHGAHKVLPSQESYLNHRVLQTLDQLANQYNVDRSAMAFAWLLKHPAGIIPIVGSLEPKRIHSLVRALDIPLSREAWYRLLIAARGEALP